MKDRPKRSRTGLPALLPAVLLMAMMAACAGCSGGDSSGDRPSGHSSGDKSAPAASQGAAEARDLSDVVLTGLDGSRSTVADYEGKILFVTFLATWNAESKEIVPILAEIHRKFNKNVRVMIVATDKQGAPVVRSFFAGREAGMDIFVDSGKTANAFGGARELPTTYILHRDGKFFHRIDGLQRRDKYENIILSMYRQHL
ncbi:MAG TPA: TlpA disulfide reductase family protein [Candidatus Krumholzibacterium sp.]|nr:TlpA disulfide reductase family protein [Candidatus Krumholzibacterium sp.]